MSTSAIIDTPAEHAERAPGRGLGIALVVIACAQLMIVLDATIVNIALPHIQTDLGFTDAGRQWVVTSYALSLGSLLLLGGRLGDILGRRRMFSLGIGIFAVASLLGGIAPTPGLLIAARILQGAGAALASPAALALINTTFPAGAARNRAMAVYAAMSGMGAAIGLILGGALTELDWRWTFFINVPIGLFVMFLAPQVLVESDKSDSRLDIRGAITATLGLFGVVFGLSHAAEQGSSWTDLGTLVPLIAGAALIAAFVIIESRTEHALLPMRIVANRTRAISLLVMLLIGAGMFALFFFLGLYVQQVMGYSPVRAGISFLPFSGGIIISAVIAQNLVARVDPKWLSGTGALMAAFGMWGFTHLSVDSNYWSHLFPYMLVMALGMGLVFIPMTITATHGVRKSDSGAAASALNTVQQIGGAIGIAGLTTVFTHYATQKSAALTGQAKQLVMQAITSGKIPANASKEQISAVLRPISNEVQTFASTQGFWVASGVLAVAAIALLLFMNVKHEELQSDEGAVAHVG